MQNLNFTIGKNLQILRKKNKFTQAELAEKLSYSDKAISKWEKGESLPPIEIFYKLAKLYDVSLDNIVGEEKIKPHLLEKDMKKRYLHITLLSILSVWLVALILFVSLHLALDEHFGMCFAWAVPVSLVVGIVFDAIWNKCKILFGLISGLVWSLLLCFVGQFGFSLLWEVLLLGIPLQIAVFICAHMVKK